MDKRPPNLAHCQAFSASLMTRVTTQTGCSLGPQSQKPTNSQMVAILSFSNALSADSPPYNPVLSLLLAWPRATSCRHVGVISLSSSYLRSMLLPQPTLPLNPEVLQSSDLKPNCLGSQSYLCVTALLFGK